eukprot:CAMPEP_0168589942 /NCGR_PEP_ID=MMETSP0420-20121227/6288_1 /TAXON_ID=498008 /ORGANISM="Pessonella sp." /LENGTH=183 /DNA_ID=CAMNT_0008625537 /DNA_START=148 /DNA_END=699 /DNA_ORIENTATION=-
MELKNSFSEDSYFNLELGSSPLEVSGGGAPPPGAPSSSSDVNKIVLLLVDTLCEMFEDYEFSDAAAEHFVLLTSAADAQATINQQLNASCNNASHEQLHAVWSLLREEIDVDDSSVYSYAPPFDNPFDPPGTLWHFNYFFYDRKRKRIMLIYASSMNRTEDNRNDMTDHDDLSYFATGFDDMN